MLGATSSWNVITEYNDGYPTTSPVGSFKTNWLGLYDMGGNVLQWCEDVFNEKLDVRVKRGSSWRDYNPSHLLSCYRSANVSTTRSDETGFRVVVLTLR